MCPVLRTLRLRRLRTVSQYNIKIRLGGPKFVFGPPLIDKGNEHAKSISCR